MDDATTWLGAVGQLLFSIAVASYLLMKFIPDLNSAHKTEMEAAEARREAAEERHRKDRADWVAEMRRLHKDCETQILALHKDSLERSEAMTQKLTEAIRAIGRGGG